MGVVPYVPTRRSACCSATRSRSRPRSPTTAGPRGRTSCAASWTRRRNVLKPGGALLLEVGGAQAGELDAELAQLGYVDVREIVDEDGDLRGIEATLG